MLTSQYYWKADGLAQGQAIVKVDAFYTTQDLNRKLWQQN